MKSKVTITIMLMACLMAFAATTEAGMRFGGGIHYLRTLGDIKDAPEFDENAIGFMGSVVLTGKLLRLEADVEAVPNFGASDKMMLQPQAYAMVGEGLYGGVGIGIGTIDGDWQSNPFFALRAGLDFLAGSLDLDVFASYRFQKAGDLEYLGSDDLNSLTFGALIRFGSKQ